MAHFPKPFFRTSRNSWFVQIGDKQIKLGPEKTGAFKRYHEMMADPMVSSAEPDKLLLPVIDSFLDYVQSHRNRHTYRWYKDRLQLFVKTIPSNLTLEELKPFHVQKWIDAYPELSSGSKRNYCRSIVRAMNWAEEQGYISRSPLAHFRKPPGGRKELVVTPAQYQEILDLTKDQEFKDLLTVTWETGCRPQESLRVEARHVDLANSRWVFPFSESKGNHRQRVVYLTPKALEITKRLMEKHPTGALFRNTDGLAWRTDATNNRFQTIQKKKGIKYCLYSFRHSFAHHAMTKGVDSITVATLLGHQDPTLLAKTYSHISQNQTFLHEQLRKATG